MWFDTLGDVDAALLNGHGSNLTRLLQPEPCLQKRILRRVADIGRTGFGVVNGLRAPPRVERSDGELQNSDFRRLCQLEHLLP